jgi:sialate O-acetylesterase
VAYFFARSLHKRLGVPIGIVNSTWGGTPVESWMSPMAMASEAGFSVVGERWRRAMRAYPKAKADWDEKTAVWTQGRDAALRKGPTAFAVYLHEHPRPGEPPGPDSKSTPMSLFNGMINPLLPFGLRGVIWYQGEANVGRSSEYQALFSAMITAWRAHIGEGDLPFYWVQLPNYADPYDASQMGWALLREAQHRTLGLPNTGEVVAIDVGDPKNLHPRNKQEVGRRLALVAKAQVYGIADDWSGPVFDHAVRDGRALRVFFRFADTGLTAGARPLQSFEIAGADGVFHPASAAISGDTVVVSSPLVADPAKVRYAWRDAPDANLFNGAGLPAAPFRSDEPGY